MRFLLKSGECLSWEEAVVWLKEQPEQRELVRACFYDDPLLEATRRYHASTEWRAVRGFLPDPLGRALDLGAGRGISSYALAKDGWNTVALEPDGSEIVGAGAIRKLAEETKLNIQIEREWGEQLPFENESFEVVHCRQVLHHAKDLKRLCSEIGRVLKQNGVFIATREHVISRPDDLDLFLAGHPLHSLYGGENAYLLDDYLEAIKASGIHLTHVLNPFQSDINLFPETVESFKINLARRFLIPWPQLIPSFLLSWLGLLNRMPGRLYTFIGCKSNG